ncbi:thioredoxin family protein [Chloroflexota bacterium]
MTGKYIRLSQTVLLLVLALLLLTAANCTTNNGETGESKVNWLYSWSEAVSRAQTENKPIMIDFYADWCPPCKQLDSDTYSDDALGAFLNDNFICIKSNVDHDNLHEYYSGIEVIPTIIFASPEGIEFGRMVGYRPPGQYYQDTQAILSQWQT